MIFGGADKGSPFSVPMLIAACVLAATWYSTRRAIWLTATLAAVIGCVVVYIAEEAFVTEGEKVELLVHELIADFRTSPIEASGSRAPSLGAIHFFSLLMMSKSNFLSSADGKYSFKCCS